MNQMLIQLGYSIRPHLSDFAMMIVATLLVIYGNSINQAVRRQVSHMHFIIRTLIFILVCAFGYGLLTVWLAPLLADALARIPNFWLAAASAGILIVLGMLAERKRQM